MAKVITAGSMLNCAHQGTVQLTASQTLLKVDGQPLLIQGDLDGAPISGCTIPLNPVTGTKPCTMITSMATGAGLKLKVGGKAVLLETAAGTTDGVTVVPSNFWHVQSAEQTKLEAI